MYSLKLPSKSCIIMKNNICIEVSAISNADTHFKAYTALGDYLGSYVYNTVTRRVMKWN